MNEQNTEKIVEELKLCNDFKTFYDENKQYQVSESLSETLNRLLKEKGLRKADAIRKSELSEIYGYQIFSGVRTPERKKLLCLALAMELSLDQVQTLLRNAGYPPLYVKIPFDSVVMYGICKRMAVLEVNNLLFRYGCESLR